eukprot:1546491-Amphidinium_carterae.1
MSAWHCSQGKFSLVLVSASTRTGKKSYDTCQGSSEYYVKPRDKVDSAVGFYTLVPVLIVPAAVHIVSQPSA